MDQSKNFPWEIKAVPEEELAEIDKHRTGGPLDAVRVGPSDYYLPLGFLKTGPEVRNMELRSSDVFVVTFPRSGTTWTQELVWLIGNDFDYKRAAEIKLTERFPFLEFAMIVNDVIQPTEFTLKTQADARTANIFTASVTELLRSTPSPHFIKSHLPLSLLPPTLLDTAKVVYVARDPRDVAVSFYHHYQLFKAIGFAGDFKTFWKFFIEGRVMWSPFFPHVKEAWEKRNHPNMLFLFYEEMYKDLPAVVRRVAQFLAKPITEDQVRGLCDHLHIDNFKNNISVNSEEMGAIGMFDEKRQPTFIRKGKAGGWHEHFDEEMTAQAERWIADNLRDTDLSFPQYS